MQIRQPSTLTPAQLAAEVKRCTREDGTVGLVSLCLVCHREADRLVSLADESSVSVRNSNYQYTLRRRARNRELDKAAKIARVECECDDDKCHRPVTADDADMFEWDHLVQSFEDRDYVPVSCLVGGGQSVAKCDKERSKCRLLYFKCHRKHTAEQVRRAARRRAGRPS
jgi:hypothetical protein